MKSRNLIPGVFLVIGCLIALAPLVWHGITSLKGTGEILLQPPTWWPHDPTLTNYEDLLIRRPFGRYYLNSFVISTLASLLCVGVATLASYGLARSTPRFRRMATSTLLGVAFFPPITFLFPLYEMVRAAGLVNNPWSLILPYAALNLPFSVWLLTHYFSQIPYELEEAAAVDGMSRFETLRRIILPISIPALVTTGILAFIFAWNEFMLALTFLQAEAARTVTVGVATLGGSTSEEIPWGLMAAAVMVSSLPLALFVILFQRHIVAGLTAGAGK